MTALPPSITRLQQTSLVIRGNHWSTVPNPIANWLGEYAAHPRAQAQAADTSDAVATRVTFAAGARAPRYAAVVTHPT